MTTQNNDRPPLTPITESGVYRLSLSKPKLEKVKAWEDGTVSARLFFKTVEGKCLSQQYGTKYPKSLAMLVGKISGKYTPEIRMGALPAEFIDYIAPACNQPTEIAVEVTPNGEWNGQPQYKYKLSFGKGTMKPSAPKPNDEAIDF